MQRFTHHLLAGPAWVLVLLLFGVGCHSYPARPGAKTTETAVESGFSDLHNSVLYRLFSKGNPGGLEDEKAMVSLESMQRVQAKLMVLSIGVPRFDMEYGDTTRMEDVLRFLGDFREKVTSDWPQLVVAEDSLDPIAIGLKEGLKKGKIGLTFALEGSWLLDGNPDWVDSLYHLGVRMIGPAHRFHNSFFLPPAELEESLSRAPSFLHPESTLSESGIALIDRMIARGMLIDVSHLPEAAFWQVVKINDNRTPLIASHANAYALCPVVRNLKKAQIEAIVESNGLIGICFHQKLLGGKNSRPGIPELVDHLVYMLEVAGEDQVALGSDLEGLISPAVGLERLDLVPGIRLEMKKRGISQKVIEKVMWENALQLF